MDIQLLGTGSAEGMPGIFCKCPTCTGARAGRGKDIRSRSSAIIDGSLKIDLPPDTFYQTINLGLDMTNIEALVFTHSHDDHLAEAELQYMSWMFVPDPRTTRLPVTGSVTVIDKIRAKIDTNKVIIDLIELAAWQTVPLSKWNITPIVANHDPGKVCFNLIIERKGRNLLYATDTGWYADETWEYLSGIKLHGAVVEASRGPEEDYDGHLRVEDVIRFREKLIEIGSMDSNAPLATTHHSHRGQLLHKQIEEILVPHNILVGYDGLEFSISSA